MAEAEIKYLSILNSKNIVKLYASKVEGERVYMLMDYFDVSLFIYRMHSRDMLSLNRKDHYRI